MTTLNVTAKNAGQYGDRHRRPGESFTLAAPGDFAANWMQAVGWTPPAPPPTPKIAAPTVDDMRAASARIAQIEEMLDAERTARRAVEAEAAAHRSRAADLEAQLAAKTPPAEPATPPPVEQPAEKPPAPAEQKPAKPPKPTATET